MAMQQAQSMAQAGTVKSGMAGKMVTPIEVDMARQDAFRVCNPDVRRPFTSLGDACDRLLPYHVVADYQIEDTDDVQRKGATSPRSRSQAWNDTMTAKSVEYFDFVHAQVNYYNSLVRSQFEGEMRGEERLMVEQWLLLDEKAKLVEVREQIEQKEKAETEAARAKMEEAIAQADKARAEALARAEAQARAEAAKVEAQARAAALQAEIDSHLRMQVQGVDLPGNMLNSQTQEPGWSSGQSDGDVSGDLWNEEEEHDVYDIDGGTTMSMQDDWEDAELDLNAADGSPR